MRNEDPRTPLTTQPTFMAFLSRRPMGLLRVDAPLSLSSGFPPGVVDYLDTEYPGKIAYGLLGNKAVPIAAWWKKHFGTFATNRSFGPWVPDGYYLFSGQAPVFRTSGKPNQTSEEAMASLLMHTAGVLLNASKGVRKAERAKDADALVRQLDPVIQRLLAPAQAPKPTVKPPEADPYTVIGVSPSCSSDELKAAYRNKVALTHPDKVAHLSSKLREFAEEETKRIHAAYDLIKQKRGTA